jgi:hypothetical protein
MHAAAVATTDHKDRIERAHARLDHLESLVPVLRHQAAAAEAWNEFRERGRKHDA